MPRRPWDERRREIQEELLFASTGVGDLVNVCDEDDDTQRCVECGAITPCAFEVRRA